MRAIDLNADVGEMDAGLDAQILTVVSSVNIACGGHAGDPSSMRRVAEGAAERGVRIGAHPSYVDREGFGRTRQDVPAAVLAEQVAEQILDLAGHSPAPVEYVKPHGALYHAAGTDPDVAGALLEAVALAGRELGKALALMGQVGAHYVAAGEREGVVTILEGFADRTYLPDGRLVPRSHPRAVLTDHGEVVEQVVGITRGRLRTLAGELIDVRAHSVCVHSDTPGAVALAHGIRLHLEAAGIAVRARP